jgi:hypothetical protein
MANKNARILWAAMTREAGFDAQHVSVKPPGKCTEKPARSAKAQSAPVTGAAPLSAPSSAPQALAA